MQLYASRNRSSIVPSLELFNSIQYLDGATCHSSLPQKPTPSFRIESQSNRDENPLKELNFSSYAQALLALAPLTVRWTARKHWQSAYRNIRNINKFKFTFNGEKATKLRMHKDRSATAGDVNYIGKRILVWQLMSD